MRTTQGETAAKNIWGGGVGEFLAAKKQLLPDRCGLLELAHIYFEEKLPNAKFAKY